MILNTARFGPIEVDDGKIINFRDGLPGFEQLHNYVVLSMEESKPLYWLQSIDESHVALPVIDPFLVIDNYSIDINDDEIAELEIKSEEDLLLLVVTVIPEDIEKMTANLAAPILVNIHRGVGKQIMIDNKDYPIRFPVFEAMYKVLKGAQQNAGIDAQGR